MFLSLFVIAVVLLWYYWYKRPFNAPPGPRGLPILGMIPFLSQRPEKKFCEWSKKYGPVMSVRIGQRDWVVLNSASSIKEALIKHGDKLNGRPKTDKLFGEDTGIIYADGERWKMFRKFGEITMRNLGVGKSSFETNIMNEIDSLIFDIEQHINEPYDIRCEISNAIHRIMCIILFGKEARYEIPKGSYEYLEDPKKAMLYNMMLLLPFLRFIPAISKVLHEAEITSEVSHKIYSSILTELEKNLPLEDPTTFVEAYAIQKKAENEKMGRNLHFTESLFSRYTGDMFVAGIHTTTNAISWCLIGLLHYPHYQKKVRSEINKVIGKKKPFIAARNSMPFTMAYLHEIFRYCTLVPLAIPHRSTVDVIIEGYKIIKGTQVMINVWSAHNDTSVFENPERFRPERFLDENGNFTPSKHVIPFSVGPRHCLGEQLARMEMFLFFVSILQKFCIDLDKESDLPGLDDGVSGLIYVPKPFKFVLSPL